MWHYDKAETPRHGLAYASFPQLPVMRERAQQLCLSKAKGASELRKHNENDETRRRLMNSTAWLVAVSGAKH